MGLISSGLINRCFFFFLTGEWVYNWGGGKLVSGGGLIRGSLRYVFQYFFQNSHILFKLANFAYNVHYRKGAQIQEPVGQKESNERSGPPDCQSDTLTTRSLSPGVSEIMQWIINPVIEKKSIQIK